MSEEIHGRHLEHLSDIIAGRTSPFTELVFDLLKTCGVFRGATSLRGGSDGFVPAPAAGDEVKFLCGDGTWRAIPNGKVILNNIPATVNGGMWYELEHGMPAVKIYYNWQKYPVGMLRDPSLTVTLTSSSTITAVNPGTATVSYEGGGNISIETNPEVEFTYENGTITIPYTDVEGAITVTVRLSSSPGFKGASKSFTVTTAKLPSNLRVTPTATTIPADSYINATVQYDDPKAQITVTCSNSNVVTSYTNKKVAVRYASGVASATVTVKLTASAGYTDDTKTFNVTMEKLSPNLKVGQTEYFTAGKTLSIPVSRRGTGNITVKPSSTKVSAEYSDGVITVPYVGFTTNTTVRFTVTVAADSLYDAMTVYFTVTYIMEPTINLQFEDSLIKDLGSNPGTWRTYGAPFIYQLAAWSQTPHASCAGFYTKENVVNGLENTTPIKIGGQDFTIRFWFYYHADDSNSRVFEAIKDETDGTAKNSIFIHHPGNKSYCTLHINDSVHYLSMSYSMWHLLELVYQHDIQTATFYFNGRTKFTIEEVIPRYERQLRIGYSVWNIDKDEYKDRTRFPYLVEAFDGYIDDFRIYDGVALHTSDFLPTEEL